MYIGNHFLGHTCYYSVYTAYVHVLLNGLPVKHIHHWLPTSYCRDGYKLLVWSSTSREKPHQFVCVYRWQSSVGEPRRGCKF